MYGKDHLHFTLPEPKRNWLFKNLHIGNQRNEHAVGVSEYVNQYVRDYYFTMRSYQTCYHIWSIISSKGHILATCLFLCFAKIYQQF